MLSAINFNQIATAGRQITESLALTRMTNTQGTGNGMGNPPTGSAESNVLDGGLGLDLLGQ